MFLCQFDRRHALPVHGNPRWAALKRAMHLQLVTEITLGINPQTILKLKELGKIGGSFMKTNTL
jgi:hypothetical protein